MRNRTLESRSPEATCTGPPRQPLFGVATICSKLGEWTHRDDELTVDRVRPIFSSEHEQLRIAFREFIQREVIPHQAAWRASGQVDRALWRKAGQLGFLCPWLGPEWEGPGGDFLHSVVVLEELARAHEPNWMVQLHSDVVAPYLARFGSEAQRRRWLVACARGDAVGALALTEPGAGSDLSAVTTCARKVDGGYVLSGQKCFVSLGRTADFALTLARVVDAGDNKLGLTLFIVPSDRFERSAPYAKIGLTGQDTCDLSFDDARLSDDARLGGQDGLGMFMLMQQLPTERLLIAIYCQAMAEQVHAETCAYVKQRIVFQQPLARFQNTQFRLAECAAEIAVGRGYLDGLLARHVRGERLGDETAIAKLWHSELASRVANECLQLFGGAGFMADTPVARAFVDARVQAIYGGTSEIMKLIIARRLGLG